MRLPSALVRSAALALLLAAGLSGCDFLSKARGVMKAAQQVSQHLEADLKAPLTAERIDRVLALTPELMAFSAEAEQKWTLKPGQGDAQELAQGLGALTDYLAFFEARDTRLTAYWADLLKIHDARAQILWKQGRAEAQERLEAERAELEARQAAAGLSAEEAADLETRLEQNRLALAQLEQIDLEPSAAEDATPTPVSAGQGQAGQGQAGQGQAGQPYRLSAAEIELVRSRMKEIEAVFQAAGYVAKSAPGPDSGAGKDASGGAGAVGPQ